MPRITDIQRIANALDAAPGKRLTVPSLAQLLHRRTELVAARLNTDEGKALFHVNKESIVTKRRAPRKAKAEQLALPYQDVPEYTSAGEV